MKRRVARAYAWTRNKPGKWRVAPREGCTRNYGCHNRWRRLEEGMEVTMPAVTAETLTLPRLPHPGPELVDRPVVSVTTAPSGLEGEGFPVRRAFAGVDLGILDPFVHMDQMGEVDYGPGEPKGTPWHPHRGFETVTYMIDGILRHQDSNGGALLRVIAGEVAGHQGPGVTYTPITLLHATLAPGAQLRLPWRPDFNALVYVLAGSGSVGTQ